jgi:hypothetical protein
MFRTLHWSVHSNHLQIFCVAQYVISVLSYVHGTGRHTYYVKFEHIQKVLLLSFAGQLLWIWSITLVKVSVALSLTRITPSKLWARVLYWFIGFLLISAVVFVSLQLVQCTPISTFWNPQPGGECWKKADLALSGYIVGGTLSALIPSNQSRLKWLN